MKLISQRQAHTTIRRLYSATSGSGGTSGSSISKSTPTYIPLKMKEEIISLHDEDPSRWNATTLSARFGANHANVAALLRLAYWRGSREKYLKTLDAKQRERLEELRQKNVSAWSELTEVGAGSGIRGGYKRAKPSAILEEDEKKEVEEQEEIEVKEEVKVLPPSAWTQWLEKEANNAPTDAQRRTTFAFVEIGAEKRGERGAVWFREGHTGKLRFADEEERRLLLSHVRYRDSTAFL